MKLHTQHRLAALTLAFVILFTVAITGLPATASTVSGQTDVTGLTVNYKENPLGVEADRIIFGWKMESTVIGQGQKSYSIIVTEDTPNGLPVWNSGTVTSGKSVGVPFGGNPLNLKPETRYYWTLKVTDVSGATYSKNAWFETGADWASGGAEWITVDGFTDTTYSLAFRTEKELSGTNFAYARLYITSAGAYQAYVNGKVVQPVGKTALLGPGWTNPMEFINYQVYDVTSLINGDKVALSALVGRGWNNRVAATGFQPYGSGSTSVRELCLLAKLVITYENGTQQVICTNTDDWKVTADTPLAVNGVNSAEVYDARKVLPMGAWNDVNYTAGSAVSWSNPIRMQYNGAALRASDNGMVYEYETLDWTDAYQYKDWEAIVETETVGSGPQDRETILKSIVIVNANDIIPGPLHTLGSSEYRTGEIDFTKASRYTPGTQDIVLKDGNTLVLDFGQNAAAMPRLELSGVAGTVLKILPGENISDGNTTICGKTAGWSPNNEPIPKGVVNHRGGAGNGKDFTYTLSGVPHEVYDVRYTFVGYRYLGITATGGDVTVHKAQSVAVSSVDEESGFVETSNPLINQFLSNSKWSQVGNYNSVPTDCPTREFSGWTGDIQVFSETGLYNFNSIDLLGNYIEIMQEGSKRTGGYNDSMPTTSNSFAHSPGWTDAAIIVPWAYYQQTGDATLLSKYWSELTQYTDRLNSTGVYDGIWSGPYGAGIGVNGDGTGWGDHMGTYIPSGQFTTTVYHLLDNILMAKMATVLGKTADAQKYQNKTNELSAYMKNRYLTENGDVLSASAPGEVLGFAGMPWGPYTKVDNAQTAIAWMLKLGLWDTELQRAKMAENLAKNVANEGRIINPLLSENTIAAGFLGVHVLMPMLSQNGQSVTAYALMNNTERNTFLYPIAAPPEGATTTWEEWVIWGDANTEGWGKGSQNHYSYGASALWLYEYVLGIQRDEENPAFKHFILQPTPDGSLDYAKGSYDSYYGKISSRWTAGNGALKTYSAVVPANTSATLYLPVESVGNLAASSGATYKGMTTHNGLAAAEFELLSGGYDFAITP
ncbi:MAG: glycoside hydrolase family 78 protein, partial [Oscillospiraceae bacterium]|nr:glycoside hydrolase family 78 protein [Oscillospiraceae bacterium]